jgi:hypothetical protein
MTRFIKSENSYHPTQDMITDIYDNIPVGTYVVNSDPKGNFFLTITDDFVIPEKIYGNSIKNCSRILNTFNSRQVSTGVLLSGTKGSGKSLLAKQISVEAMKNGVPTLIVNLPYRGDGFNSFLQSIRQDCVVIFDEFEKVYDEKEQSSLLTLLDGVCVQKKLFIMTTNSVGGINSFLRDRPGRIYYWIEFKNLEHQFILEYCEDKLNNKKYIDQVCNICALLGFNFDMLKALVEEMNLYDESPQTSMKLLNTRGTIQGHDKYEYVVHDESNPSQILFKHNWRGTPLNARDSNIVIGEYLDEDGDMDYIHARIDSENIIRSDFRSGSYVFKVEHENKTYIIKMIKAPVVDTLDRAYAYVDM